MERTVEHNGDTQQTRTFLCYLGAVLLMRVSNGIVNSLIFPQFNDIFPEAREIATIANALFLLLVSFLALRDSRPFSTAAFLVAPFLLATLGSILTLMGISLNQGFVVTTGACFMSVGNIWTIILMVLALMRLNLTRVFFCVILATIANNVVAFVLSMLPDAFSYAVFFLSPLCQVLLIYTGARQTLREARSATSPADLSLMNPLSFLPFSNRLFISFFIFSVAAGFALAYGSVESNPPSVHLSFIPLALILLVALVRRRRVNIDVIFLVALLLVIAGYLTISMPTQGLPFPLTNTLLLAGSDCFGTVMWLVLTAVGKRNIHGALAVSAFGQFVSVVGTIIGVSLGHLTNRASLLDTSLESLSAAFIVLGVIAYCFIALRSFSFEGTIETIKPLAKPRVATDATSMDIQCGILARKHALTPREHEILGLLARGRNTEAMREKLIVSQNTIKTHVKSVYAKLDIHSQQELIDLVENTKLP
jgi:DNA-binding CsgD family transcriptional regulator